MMNTRLLVGAGLFAMMGLLACAADPNKQANDAHDGELKSERKQLQNTADERSETRVTAAKAEREDTQVNASGSPATQERVVADAKLTEARDSFRAKATGQLEKLDARTSELRQLVERAGGKATTASRDALKTVETQRSLVTRELDRLPTLANDDWDHAKVSLETQLDNLDGLVKKAASEVSKFKK
jgi:hypothetical protein